MRRLFAVIVCLALLLGLCGCGSDEQTVVYIALDEISTLDPQLVTSPADRTVVLNTFEGLLRFDANDAIIPAAASEYYVEGLEYTFEIDPDLCWSDGTPLTAFDFEFAFRRAASPETNAPDFTKISCIKGAKEVKNGANVSNLAVYALDSHTLKITLAEADENFLQTLTEPIAMPCNEEFFRSTKGKYGRNGENIISNGNLYVYSWRTENYRIRLKRNPHYGGHFAVLPDEIYLTAAEEDEKLSLLSDKDIDLSLLESTLRDSADEKGLYCQSYFDKYLFIVVNKNSALGNADVRRALSLSIHRIALENSMPSYILPLLAAVQPDAEYEGTGIYGDVSAEANFAYLPDEAYRLFLDYTKQNGTPEASTILFPAELKIDSLVSGVAAGWQQNLGCYINMTALDTNSDVLKKIESGDYTVAIMALSSGDKNAYELLSQFRSGNILGFKNAQFDKVITSLHTKSTTGEYIKAIVEAQKLLLDDCSIIPIAATPTVVCHTDDIAFVHYNIANESIDFSTIRK
ncbi:MAG: peptide ABC transporter substrate-binding protein [Clostridia bacterium]|nr:peptide ABC transporter substrate-binding protein [Clostridia bacterium]